MKQFLLWLLHFEGICLDMLKKKKKINFFRANQNVPTGSFSFAFHMRATQLNLESQHCGLNGSVHMRHAGIERLRLLFFFILAPGLKNFKESTFSSFGT